MQGKFRGRGGGARGSLNRRFRALQQKGHAEVAKVHTAEELKAAVDLGVPHIQTMEHLDLSDLQLAAGSRILGTIPKTVKSIRVRFLMFYFSNTALELVCHVVDPVTISAV